MNEWKGSINLSYRRAPSCKSAEGAFYTSLGQRPRLLVEKRIKG